MVDFTKPQKESPYAAPQTQETQPKQGNLILGVVAGLVVSVLGAMVWASIGYYLNIFPVVLIILIAAAIGVTIQALGQENSPLAGISGALLGIFAWFLGSMFFVLLDGYDGDYLMSLQTLLDVTIWPQAISVYITDYNEGIDLIFDVVFVIAAAIVGFSTSVKPLGAPKNEGLQIVPAPEDEAQS